MDQKDSCAFTLPQLHTCLKPHPIATCVLPHSHLCTYTLADERHAHASLARTYFTMRYDRLVWHNLTEYRLDAMYRPLYEEMQMAQNASKPAV